MARSKLRLRDRFPILAVSALLAAFVSVFLSLAVLLAIDGHPVWPQNGIYRVVQPASCLSLILSFAAVMIAFALREGFTYTWWHRHAQGADITTLQKLWCVGDRTRRAAQNLFDSKHRHYLAIPVVFITILPIAGMFLQSAIVTVSTTISTPTTIQIPIVPNVDVGFSGNESTATNWSPGFGWVWQQVVNPVGGQLAQYAYFGSSNSENHAIDLGYDQSSMYTVLVPGAGFDYNCSSPQLTFNLLPTAENQSTSGMIFQSSIDWSPDQPNNIEISVQWKQTSDCIGTYNATRCTLRAATVEYPVTVAMNVSNSHYEGPFFSLQRLQYGTPDKVLSILPVSPSEGQNNLFTYSGVRNAAAYYYNSTFEIVDALDPSSSSFSTTGTLSQQLQPAATANGSLCSLSYAAGLGHVDKFQFLDSNTINTNVAEGGIPQILGAEASPAYMIINQIRQAMFLSSVYIGSQAITDAWAGFFNTNTSQPRDHFVQTVPAIRTRTEIRYKIRLYSWGASVAIVWAAVVLIAPLLWGFRDLPYRKDLSPVETARGFNAPVFKDVSDDEKPAAVLEQVGSEKPEAPIDG